MMETPIIQIKIASAFSTCPGPRYIIEGDYSGQLFRETILKEAIKGAIEAKCKISVDLDGTAGYGTSFLEESFGGLIREDHIAYADIKRYLEIISKDEPNLIDDINAYLEDAHENSHI